jgi:ABC-type tungstate transport system permease subunit
LLVTGPPNQYEMCLINANKHPNLAYNQDLAEKFFSFVAGPEGRKIIEQFGRLQYGESLYHSDSNQNPR